MYEPLLSHILTCPAPQPLSVWARMVVVAGADGVSRKLPRVGSARGEMHSSPVLLHFPPAHLVLVTFRVPITIEAEGTADVNHRPRQATEAQHH